MFSRRRASAADSTIAIDKSTTRRGRFGSFLLATAVTGSVMTAVAAPAQAACAPRGGISYVGKNADGSVTLVGWAYDPCASSKSNSVSVYFDQLYTATIPANQPHSGVNSTYRISGNHGFRATIQPNRPVNLVRLYSRSLTGSPQYGLGSRHLWFTPGGTVYPSTAQALGQRLSARAGWTGSQWTCLQSLWQKESGWNYKAYNPSGAYGIPQALPGGKMSSPWYGTDWRGNPLVQIHWGLGYIKGRYGTPCGAWNHSRAYNWY